MTLGEPHASDQVLVDALLEPGETLLHAAPAAASMQRAGVVALAYSVPVFAISWFPLRMAVSHLGTPRGDDLPPLLVFAAVGLLFAAIGLRLLFEPWRRHLLYPHVVYALTDRRLLQIDRRSGPIHSFGLGDIWQMKVFAPFGRIRLWRRGLVSGTGKRAKFRDFDGVPDPAAVAQAIAELTGVPVGIGQDAVAASVAQMSPERRARLR